MFANHSALYLLASRFTDLQMVHHPIVAWFNITQVQQGGVVVSSAT